MKIGILADTHDNLRSIRYFMEWFNDRGTDLLIHAGDFISPFTIPALNGFDGPVVGVFGNNDGDRETLRAKVEETNVTLHEAPHREQRDGLGILLSHRPADLPDEIPRGIDLVIHGHTHEPRVEDRDNYTLINPGEAGGWLTETARGMMYDSDEDSLMREAVPAP